MQVRTEDPLIQSIFSVLDERLNNPARLAVVRQIDPPQSAMLEGFATSVAKSLRASGAFLHIIDADSQVACSYVGIDSSGPVRYSYCGFVVANEDPVIIDDTSTHPFAAMLDLFPPGVERLKFGAYLGVPVMCRCEIVGALCVIDTHPREWTDMEVAQLQVLGHFAEELICKIEGE